MTKRILLADDSVITRKVVELAFTGPHYHVSSIAEATASAERLAAEDPDLVLIATAMPQGAGYDLCATIRKNPRTAWIPLILIAGSFEPFDEPRARAAGAGGHLRKPFQTKELVSLVERLMREHPRPGAPRQPAPAPAPRPSSPVAVPRQSVPRHQAEGMAAGPVRSTVISVAEPLAAAAPPASSARPASPAGNAPFAGPAPAAVPAATAPPAASPEPVVSQAPAGSQAAAARDAINAIAEKVVEPAVDLGRSLEATYTLLRVVDSGLMGDLPTVFAPRIGRAIVAQHEAEAATYLREIASKMQDRGLEVKTRVVTSEPAAAAILDVAEREGCSLVAMATHGRSGLSRMVMGSVAGEVLQGAKVPVLLYRPKVERRRLHAQPATITGRRLDAGEAF